MCACKDEEKVLVHGVLEVSELCECLPSAVSEGKNHSFISHCPSPTDPDRLGAGGRVERTTDTPHRVQSVEQRTPVRRPNWLTNWLTSPYSRWRPASENEGPGIKYTPSALKLHLLMCWKNLLS